MRDEVCAATSAAVERGVVTASYIGLGVFARELQSRCETPAHWHQCAGHGPPCIETLQLCTMLQLTLAPNGFHASPKVVLQLQLALPLE